MSVKRVCVEWGRLMVVLVQTISVLNHENDFRLRRNVEAFVIKLRDTRSLSAGASQPSFKKAVRALVLNYLLLNINLAYVGHSGVHSEESR